MHASPPCSSSPAPTFRLPSTVVEIGRRPSANPKAFHPTISPEVMQKVWLEGAGSPRKRRGFAWRRRAAVLPVMAPVMLPRERPGAPAESPCASPASSRDDRDGQRPWQGGGFKP